MGVVDAATGIPLNVTRYRYPPAGWGGAGHPRGSPLTAGEARARAEALRARLEALGLRPVRLVAISRAAPWVTLRGNFSYTFTYARLAHGIPVGTQGFRVAVNGDTGEVTELAVQWDRDLHLPLPPRLVAPSQAERIFRARVGLFLRYEGRPGPPHPPGSPSDYVPVYGLPLLAGGTGPPVIDAVSGRVLDGLGRPVNLEGAAGLPGPVRAPGEGNPAATVYGAAYGSGQGESLPAGPGARDAAVAWAARLVALPADLRPAEVTYDDGRERGLPARATWRVVWRSTSKGRPLTSAEALVDATMGDLISYFAVEGPQGARGKPRPITGRVVSVTCPADPPPAIPSPPRLLPRPEAEEAYLAKISLALWYVPVPAGAGGAAAYRPAYVPGGFGLPPRWLDARTGEPLDEFLLTPPEAAEAAAAAADARGHPLEREMRTAASLGLLPPRDGRSRPDEAVTRGEFLAALARFNTTLEALFGELAVRAGGPQALPPIPRPVGAPAPAEAGDPAAPVTREELAALSLRALGYDGLLGADPAYFSLPFADAGQASAEARPALAVAASLGILRPRDGLLRPAEPLTRAEAAAALLRLRALAAAP